MAYSFVGLSVLFRKPLTIDAFVIARSTWFAVDFPLRLGPSILAKLSLSALETTQKLDILIASAPKTGLSVQPKIGVNKPEASGMPIML